MESHDIPGCTVRFSVTVMPDGKPQGQDLAFVSGPEQGMKRGCGGMWSAGSEGNGLIIPAKKARTDGWALAMTPTATAKGAPIKGAASAPKGASKSTATQAFGTVKSYGTVKSFNAMKGFGFLECPELVGTDVYFKATMVPEELHVMLQPGLEVYFELRYTQDGKPQASNLEFQT